MDVHGTKLVRTLFTIGFTAALVVGRVIIGRGAE